MPYRISAVYVCAAISALLPGAIPALACTPHKITNPTTGESWSSDTPEAWRREQADWHARSDAIVIAQVSAMRLISRAEMTITLAPVDTLIDGKLPDTNLSITRVVGHTCDFTMALADYVIVYAALEVTGWQVVGLVRPNELQTPPANLRARLREMERGLGPQPRL